MFADINDDELDFSGEPLEEDVISLDEEEPVQGAALANDKVHLFLCFTVHSQIAPGNAASHRSCLYSPPHIGANLYQMQPRVKLERTLSGIQRRRDPLQAIKGHQPIQRMLIQSLRRSLPRSSRPAE